jgi:hypothetical protein
MRVRRVPTVRISGRFAADSPLEGTGFEPSVPRQEKCAGLALVKSSTAIDGIRPRREQAIRERAYAMWEDEGRPDGKDLDHWYRDDAEIDSSGEYVKDKMPDDVQQSPKPAASRSREGERY